MNSAFYLALAIVCEVIATSSLRLSEGFTKPLPSLIVVIGYGAAFYLLSQALRTIPLGTAYAVWSGLGTAAIAIIGVILFAETLNLWRIIGIVLIITGVLVLNLLGGASH
ncbi:MAG: multidrug efflux SMR transporter [Anaerolineae bacterium]|jgi:multidrug transporter EmrE-like cation transporter|nr:multidrug efflux SMR transporter [Anaerolineae bacterium]